MIIIEKISMRVCLIFLAISFLLFSCGTRTQNVTLIYKLDSYPAYHLVWAPSGEQLAFSSLSGSKNASAIYILNVETRKAQLFLDASYGNLQAQTWTPDGTGLIFSASSSNEFEPGDWLADINGNNAPQPFAESGVVISLSSTNQMALVQKNSDASLSIFIQDAKTNEKKVIFNDSAIAIGPISWSANGNKLTFGLDHGESRRRDIYIYDLKTQEIQRLTDEGTNDSPTLSPNGNMIAYIKGNFSAEVPSYSLHIMSSDRKCDIQVPGLADVGSPAWSPDGRQIAFVGNDNEIYLLDLSKAFGEGFVGKGLSCP